MRRHETTAELLGRLFSVTAVRFVSIVEAVAFWGAVLVPIGYFPALVIGTPSTIVAAMVGLNVTCLVVGHRYRPGIDRGLLGLIAETGEGEH